VSCFTRRNALLFDEFSVCITFRFVRNSLGCGGLLECGPIYLVIRLAWPLCLVRIVRSFGTFLENAHELFFTSGCLGEFASVLDFEAV
jgi:hypothetical protein